MASPDPRHGKLPRPEQDQCENAIQRSSRGYGEEVCSVYSCGSVVIPRHVQESAPNMHKATTPTFG